MTTDVSAAASTAAAAAASAAAAAATCNRQAISARATWRRLRVNGKQSSGTDRTAARVSSAPATPQDIAAGTNDAFVVPFTVIIIIIIIIEGCKAQL